eukprot:m.173632 g.173632  ORF g.173632 m.173632 type:complete len:183 (-) comp10409_c0_seq6:105-653(-)
MPALFWVCCPRAATCSCWMCSPTMSQRRSGRRRCSVCQGHGQTTCSVCLAYGELVVYLRLTITWTNHVDERTTHRAQLPENTIRLAPGTEFFSEEQPQLAPLVLRDEDAVSISSKSLLDEHSTNFSHTERILRQKHSLTVIPIYCAHYVYKDRINTFWIYGTDQQTHVPDYPAKACFGCVLS